MGTQCSSEVACATGCCSTYGNCGFGAAYCGVGNCTNNCDAVSECGQYAAPGKELCPLGVCCSQYGYCGTTSDFCSAGCQNGCEDVTAPSCSGNHASSGVRVGYFESWSTQRSCDAWQPEYINPQLWTHINFAFAVVGSDGRIAAMNSYDTQLYPRVTGLKAENHALKVFISVGGWDAGGPMFSNMMASASSRATFIASALHFMDSYGFDGIDIDWEYPAAGDRGGVPADTANFVQFLKELRAATGGQYGVTATLPSSYWYMQGFDIAGMQPYVDWFNFMSYDIHGTWDGQSASTQAIVQPHTNLTEISQGLDLLWRNGISPSKVVLGLGFYGRSFTLASSSCNTVDCPFISGGEPGPCTQTAGILSDKEIAEIIAANGLTPTEDLEAGVKWITWGGNQWVSYDDADTFQLKLDFADSLCLAGVMVWALDLDTAATQDSAYSLHGGALAKQQERSGGPALSKEVIRLSATQTNYQNAIALMVFWTACMFYPKCPTGYTILTTATGKVFDFDSSHVIGGACAGAGTGMARALCIEADVDASYDCSWQNYGSACQGTCSDDYFLVTQNSRAEGSRYGCMAGSYSSFCCTGLQAASYSLVPCAATTVSNLLSGGMAPTVANASEGPPREYLSTYEECAWANGATLPVPDGIPVPIPGVWAAEGGKIINNYEFNPINYNSVPPALDAGNEAGCIATVTSRAPESTTYIYALTRTCDGARWPQACHHYSSVAKWWLDTNPITCSRYKFPLRTLPATWNTQHNTQWREWVAPLPANRGVQQCQRDEYPPAVMDNSGTQWIRFIPGSDNMGAGSLFRGICPPVAPVSSTTLYGGIPDDQGRCTDTISTTVTIPCLSLAFTNMPYATDGIDDNECQPQLVTHDPGFALLAYDPWYYIYQGAEFASRNPAGWANPIPQSILDEVHANPAGWTAHPGENLDDGSVELKRRRKRNLVASPFADHADAQPSGDVSPKVRYNVVPADLNQEHLQAFLEEEGGGLLSPDFDPDTLTVNDELTGLDRKATDQELWELFGLLRCESEDCEEERLYLLEGEQLDPTKPREAPVPSPTPASAYSKPLEDGESGSRPGRDAHRAGQSLATSHQPLDAGLPRVTAPPQLI